jgi:hypothetical protein
VFAWLATAAAVGGAVGSATAGVVAEAAGPQAAFVLAGAFGAFAVAVVLAGSRSARVVCPRDERVWLAV